MAMQLRPYQKECLVQAKAKNTIVCLPTGFGKTLIAARLLEYYLQVYPQKKVAFLVPTRPLVHQQAQYCLEHCKVSGSPPVIQRVIGEEQASWGESDWDAAIQKCHLFLGTAALFQQAFVTDKYLNVGQFSLIVFDECHNAVGNSPMAAVMRDGVAPYAAHNSISPRILGLTASFVNGSLQNMERKRQALESLLLSNIICPAVQPKLELENFSRVNWSQSKNIRKQREAIENHVKEAVSNVGPIKDLQKVVTRCTHVFTELGAAALFFYIGKVIVQQTLDRILFLESDPNCVGYARRMQAGVPALRHELKVLSERLSSDPTVRNATSQTNKLQQLLELLNTIFGGSANHERGIVFVEQVALVSPLAKQINDFFGSKVHCGFVAGTGYQNETDRQTQLDAFKSGASQILVATATLEEGIDVSACRYVMRFNCITTTKAHIQGSGRARHPNAVIYYFDNDPAIERRKENSMTATARNSSLALNQRELQTSVASMNTAVEQRHPYPFASRSLPGNEGEVNVFNCKQIFNQYCSITLGTSVSPKTDLYKYTHIGGDPRKVLMEVRYPTPSGWQIKTSADYMNFWSGVDLEKVFHRDRVKKKTTSEKEEMAFVYLIVVELRKQSFLDFRNKPDESFRFETRRSCMLDKQDSLSYLALKNGVFKG